MFSRVYLTKEDHKILQFVEEFGGITIHEAQNMFYKTQIKGYEIARRHLSKLVSYDKLNVSRDYDFNQNIYYMTKKPPRYHDMLSLDYYSELIKNGVNIIYFKREQHWLDSKYSSDAYCCYNIGTKIFFDILEVVNTKNVEIKKYRELYESGEPQQLNNYINMELGGHTKEFPRIILLDDVRHKANLFVNENVKVIQLDLKLNNFSKLFI